MTAATPGIARPDPAFDRRNVTGSSVRAAEATASDGRGASVPAKSSCNDGGYLKSGRRWPDNRTGGGGTQSTFGSDNATLRAVELGAQAWDLTKDSCDFGDITTITPLYQGPTDLVAGAQDNVSTVDVGSVGLLGCPGALACTKVWYVGNGTVEGDVRGLRAVYP